MEKLMGQLSTHVPESVERQVKVLAEMEGVKSSEYVRNLIVEHLREKERQFQAMREVFEGTENDE